jgi:hypothetical protein
VVGAMKICENMCRFGTLKRYVQVWYLKGQRVVGAMLLNSSEMTDPVREIIRCKYCSCIEVLKSITKAVVKQ